MAAAPILILGVIGLRPVHHVLGGLCNEGSSFWDFEVDRIRGRVPTQACYVSLTFHFM